MIKKIPLSRPFFGKEEIIEVKKTLDSGWVAGHGPESRKFSELIKFRKNERLLNSFLILPPLLFSEKDFDIISYYTSKPNFITQKKVIGEIVNLNFVNNQYDLSGKIVVLESGDPGYDWIFTKGISGLITKYGGVASHMAIRCHEFGIPAAIGCGNLIFDKISKSNKISLNCESGKLELL